MAVAGSLTYDTKLDTSGYQKGINDIESKTKSGGASVKNIVAGLGITKLVTKALDTIKNSMDDAIKRIDTMNNFPKVMSNLGISAKDSEQAIKKLSDGLQGIPTTLDAGALAVQRFTSKNGDVKKSADLFLAVNDAILAGGASSQIQESALEQLTQAYSKGKMDMMEWRTLQTAMPAQLKQVASAMGLTVDELGEMMRQGDNTSETMDKFIETIVQMDKKGVKGFKSLKEQARNATGGIQTSITNMKTAITRGVANMIQQFDKLLKKNGLGGISEVITSIGKKIEKTISTVSKLLSPIISTIVKIISVLNKIAPVIDIIVGAIGAYVVAVGLAHAKTLLLNTVMNLNPALAIASAIIALTGALISYSSEASNADETTKQINETLKNYKDSMEDIAKRRQETLNVNMQEVYGYQSLYEELQKITDENGKVKEGYEERAKVISEQLNSALGTEITMNDNVIDSYQDLKKEINDTIEYKKAMAYFNAHEEEYNEAVKKKTELQNTYNKALDNSEKKQEKYNEKLKWYAKHLGVSADELDKIVKKQLDVKDSSQEMQKAYYNNALWNNAMISMRDYKGELDNANTALENSSKAYLDNQEIIYNHSKAQEYIAEKNYDFMYKIYNDTVTFNGKTQEANNKKYEEEKQAQENYLNYLRQNKDKYNEDFIKSEEDRVNKELAGLDTERIEANKKIEEKNKEVSKTTLTGINDQLKIIKDKKYEFRDAGNGNVDLYIDGVAQKTPIALETASKLATGAVEQVKNKKASAEEAGKFLLEGVRLGVGNGSLQSSVFRTVSSFAGNILATLKNGLKEKSPSKASKQYGEWLLEGLNVGINNEKNDVLNNIDNFSDDILNRMSNAVNVQTGKMAFSGTSGTVNQILTATGTTTVVNENKLLLDGDVVYENQKKVTARKNLQTQFGGAYSVSN